MPRSSSTGLYTRVDNSFSNPVIGTTISPTDADTFFDDVENSMNSFIATSTSSVVIGTGTKTLTVASNASTKSFLAGTFVQAFSQSNVANYIYGTVTSYNTSTGALVLSVTTTGGSGTITDWLIVGSGAQGATGSTGSQGSASGFKYTFNSATSGDPGSGQFLFNNATFASATAMNISETDGDGNALATFLTTLDDSTSTNKCLVIFRKENAAPMFLGYLTGTLTDNGAYDTFSLTPISAVGSIANGDACRLIPLRTGDKGADGAGTGDVSGPAASVDSEIALFSSTTGKVIKRASTTGIVKATSGVISAAAAGTDYLAPAAIGTTVQAYDSVLHSNLPVNSQSAAYTAVASDANGLIYHPSSDNNARTFTIPANASVAYATGTTLTFVNDINTVTIAITSDTLVWAGPGSTGSRSLAANGVAVATKVASTRWYISGTGLS